MPWFVEIYTRSWMERSKSWAITRVTHESWNTGGNCYYHNKTIQQQLFVTKNPSLNWKVSCSNPGWFTFISVSVSPWIWCYDDQYSLDLLISNIHDWGYKVDMFNLGTYWSWWKFKIWKIPNSLVCSIFYQKLNFW